MLATFAFYLFALVLVAAALMVVAARNPVHAVLFLILCFFNAAGLFLLLGAEFLAFTLVIVYVGAVAVLFLFVVMMLDIDFKTLRQGFLKYRSVGLGVGFVLAVQLGFMASAWTTHRDALILLEPLDLDNTRALGQVLYTDYIYPFQVAGLVLLVAMIGAIVLTLDKSTAVKRQDARAQTDRRVEDVLEIKKVRVGEGVL